MIKIYIIMMTICFIIKYSMQKISEYPGIRAGEVPSGGFFGEFIMRLILHVEQDRILLHCSIHIYGSSKFVAVRSW